MNRALGAAAVAWILLGTGCQVVEKGSYWEDMKAHKRAPLAPDETGRVERAQLRFLGVRVAAVVDPDAIGVRVQHVFGSSPAARAGLETGDEIRSVAGAPVRTPDEIRLALREIAPGTRASVVYARDGEERETLVALVLLPDYLEERRQRMFNEAVSGGIALPFFFNYATRDLSPAFVRSYFGVTVAGPVFVYQDLDIFPIVGGLSVFRREVLELYDAARVQLVVWPFRVSTEGEDRTPDLHDLAPPPPPGSCDL